MARRGAGQEEEERGRWGRERKEKREGRWEGGRKMEGGRMYWIRRREIDIVEGKRGENDVIEEGDMMEAKEG